MREDFHYDRMLAAKHDAEDAATSYGEAREEAIEEMVAALVKGKPVAYGQGCYNNGKGAKVYTLEINSADVRDEIDGELLLTVMIGQYNKCHTAMTVWFEAARSVCERHVDEYLEWRTTL